MPNNWKKHKLSEVTNRIGDGLHGTPIYDDNGEYFFINGNNLNNGRIDIKTETKRVDKSEYEKHKKDLDESSILLSINGTIGNLAFYRGEKCMLGKSACYINLIKGTDVKYMYYVFLSPVFQKFLKDIATGTTIPNVPLKGIRDFEFSLPPLPEQQAIAEILSALDDKIELNLQTNKTLEEMANALYKHWFVDFGPFKNGKFIQSELGMIPEGWEVKTIGEFVEHQKGFAFKSNWYQEEGIPIVRVSDTTDNSIDINSCNKISEEFSLLYKDFELQTNDVLIATVGSWPPNYSSVVGKVVRVPIQAKGALLNQNLVKLKMKIDGKIQQCFLYLTLKQESFLKYIVNCAQGSANQASIKLTDIFNYKISFGNSNKLVDFFDQINTLMQQQNLLINENQTLKQTRDYLLPKLISGQIRVKDTEKMVKEVL